ncbi:hypothetical protein WJX82_008033 [Trebouxia sp. C0006]
MLAAAADEPHGLSQQVEALLTALKAVPPDCQASSSLLRQILQSTTSTEPQAIPAQQLQEMFAFVENAGQKTDSQTDDSKEAIQTSYASLDTDAALMQPYIIHATAAFLDLAKVAVLSKEWLQMAGSELFATVATAMRTAMKSSIIPLLCSLAAKGTLATGMAVLEPFERLVTIGRSSADIIAGRLQDSQAKELRSFAVLNLAWSSIIRLLLVLANLPEQPQLAQSFRVAHLLQLLIGYVGHDFDILMEQQDINQLKVVRFWAQHLTRLATAFTAVSQTVWSPLAAMTAHMHNHMPLVRDADGEAMQNTCQEVQQHVLSKLGNLTAVCLPDCGPGRGMPPWIHALCCQATTTTSDGSLATQSLEAVPMAGKLAILVFMAACCRNRESGGAWQQCELFLFRQAMMPNPLRLHLLAEVWCGVIRQSSPDLAESHAMPLHPRQQLAQTLLSAAQRSCGDINRAAGQSDKGASGVLLTCMAEAVGLQQIISEQADCCETRQSFQMSLDLIGTAESGDTWSAPALHLLYLLRHMLHAGHLSHVLPALLRLQSNAQAAPYVAALAACYAEAQAPPVQLFHIILEERHWALQHEAMESLLLYVRSPKSETAEGRASPFIAMLKEYMQRSATAGTAVSAQDYSQIEEKSHAACERLPCLVARQQAREQPAHADSSIAQAVQALEQVHRSTTVHLPIYNDAQRAVMQEQLTLLAEIAQGVCGYNS